MRDNTEAQERRDEVPAPVDYFAIGATDCRWWPVSTRMAAHVLRELDRFIPPRWIHFVDLSGATVRVRTREILDVTQCSAAQRADRRRFHDRLRDEHNNEEWK